MFVNGQRPLFKGATRVPRIGGVPRPVALVIFMISATLFMTLHLWSLLDICGSVVNCSRTH